MKNIQTCSNCIHSYKNRQVTCFTCKPIKKDKMSNFKLLKEKRKNVITEKLIVLTIHIQIWRIALMSLTI
jgi:hypothetical protein